MWWLLLAAALAWEPTAAEQAAMDAADEEKYVTARRLSEELLAAEPDSLVGHAVLGQSLYESESDLPRARWHLEKSLSLFSQAYPDRTEDSPWQMEAFALGVLQDVLGAMDEREAQLARIEEHDENYSPKLVEERVWPLMKLRRYDEAREIAQQSIDSGVDWRRAYASNGLCAIAGEQGLRIEHYQRCTENLRFEQRLGYDPTVAAFNASLAAMGVLRFDESVSLAEEGTHGGTGSISNPFARLSELHMLSGQGAAAVVDIADMQKWTLKRPPHMRFQADASEDFLRATMYWLAGLTNRAMTSVDLALNQPDRMGFTSVDPRQAQAGHALVRLQIRESHRQRLLEKAAATGWWALQWERLKQLMPSPQAVADRALVRAELSDRKRLSGLLRVYMHQGLPDVQPWMAMGVASVIGPGVLEKALELAREDEAALAAQDTNEPGLQVDIEPWLTAFSAQASWERGSKRNILDRTEKALAQLPAWEALLRAQLQVQRGQAQWRSGDREAALSTWQQALETDPGAFRRLRVALPARVEGEGEMGGPVARRIKRSPRFRASGDGFVVSVIDQGAGVRGCINSPFGDQLVCANVAAADDSETPVADMADKLQVRLFRMAMGLSNLDLDSLDGTNQVFNEEAADAVDALLESLGEDEAPGEE